MSLIKNLKRNSVEVSDNKKKTDKKKEESKKEKTKKGE